MRDVDARGVGKQHCTEMDAAARAGRGVVKLARLRFCQCDQLLYGGAATDWFTRTMSGLVAIRPTGEILARVVAGHLDKVSDQ